MSALYEAHTHKAEDEGPVKEEGMIRVLAICYSQKNNEAAFAAVVNEDGALQSYVKLGNLLRINLDSLRSEENPKGVHPLKVSGKTGRERANVNIPFQQHSISDLKQMIFNEKPLTRERLRASKVLACSRR